MKQMWKLSTDVTQRAELFILHRSTFYLIPETLNPSTYALDGSLARKFCSRTESVSLWSSNLRKIVSVFDRAGDHDFNLKARTDMIQKVSELKDQLLQCQSDHERVIEILEGESGPLLRSNRDGYALVELLKQLSSLPKLALEVFKWRRKHTYFTFPLTAQEYAKAITLAGRAKNVDLALELFREATNSGIKSPGTYNAMMGAYMVNELTDKCVSLFRDFKEDEDCTPTIVTYNILISVYGRMMLIDHVETTYQEIKDLNLRPNLNTYNYLISGYVTAWLWDRMEETYNVMKENSIDPDRRTHLLMLRGYCHSGNLEKMEKMYELVKYEVDDAIMPLIRSMICRYCKSSDPDRLEKIKEFMKLIPETDYRAWLNVWLIKVYAQEGMVEEMEKYVNQAFEKHTVVTTISVMRMIISAYFKCNALDELVLFVKRAEAAEWRLCRSLYHCKMVMYGSQKRLGEMENVLWEMKNSNIDITKKTFTILCYAYIRWGASSKLEQLSGLMCKLGYGIPMELRSQQFCY